MHCDAVSQLGPDFDFVVSIAAGSFHNALVRRCSGGVVGLEARSPIGRSRCDDQHGDDLAVCLRYASAQAAARNVSALTCVVQAVSVRSHAECSASPNSLRGPIGGPIHVRAQAIALAPDAAVWMV
jgi:hypothetical protein